MHPIQAVTVGDVTKVNPLEIPGYEILLISTTDAEEGLIDLNKRFESFIQPFLGDPWGSDWKSTVTKRQIDLSSYAAVKHFANYLPLCSLQFLYLYAKNNSSNYLSGC